MGWMIVKQPNGKFSRFSEVVDDFTIMNMTEEEAIEECREYTGREVAYTKVKAGIEDHVPMRHGIKGSGLDRWNYCLQEIYRCHGYQVIKARFELIDALNELPSEEYFKSQ